MKNILKISVLLMFVFTSVNMYSQQDCNCKFGHIDTQKFLAQLPKAAEAQKVLEVETAQLQERLEIMQVEYNNKINEYMENEKLLTTDTKRWSVTIKTDKEKELESLRQRIQEFNATAQQDLQKRRAELFQPILDEVDAAIKAVGEEQGFVDIKDSNSLLYISSTVIDVTDLVRAKLGL